MDNFLFSDENLNQEQQAESNIEDCWDVLVVDDEEDIHQVTKLVLSGFEFEGKTLRFHHAYSAKEAMEVLNQEKNISVCLLYTSPSPRDRQKSRMPSSA